MRDLCTEFNSPVSWRLKDAHEMYFPGSSESRFREVPTGYPSQMVDIGAEEQRRRRRPSRVPYEMSRRGPDEYTLDYDLGIRPVKLVPVDQWWIPEDETPEHAVRATPRLPKKSKRPLGVLAAAERRLFKAAKRKRVERRKRKRVERPGWGWFSGVAERFHEPSGFMQYVGYHEGFAAWGWGKNGRYKWHKTGYLSVSDAMDAAESVRRAS